VPLIYSQETCLEGVAFLAVLAKVWLTTQRSDDVILQTRVSPRRNPYYVHKASNRLQSDMTCTFP